LGLFQIAMENLKPMSNNRIMKDIHAAAQEMIDRYGGLALDIAKDRVKQLELAADWPAHSVAIQVLSAVEELTSDNRRDD
jgi:hypothetical protein